MRRPEITRFDVILFFILSFAVAIITADTWLIMNGYDQLSASVWTFAGTLTGGEIVAFSLYQIAKEVSWNRKNAGKVLAAKHSFVKQLIEEEDDAENPK